MDKKDICMRLQVPPSVNTEKKGTKGGEREGGEGKRERERKY